MLPSNERPGRGETPRDAATTCTIASGPLADRYDSRIILATLYGSRAVTLVLLLLLETPALLLVFAVWLLQPRPASDEEILRLHEPGYLARLGEASAAGGGTGYICKQAVRRIAG